MWIVKHWMSWIVVAGVVSGAGCLDAASEGTGQVSVPLVASGAGGASYRLPPGTQMILSREGFFRQVSLDGDGPSLTIDVPPGDYLPPFVFDGAGHTTTWPLDRIEANGNVTRVEATLDPAPAFTVTEGETTSLTLQFHTRLAEVISFTLGAVTVDLAIEEGTASAYRIELAGLGMSPLIQQEGTVVPDLAPFQDLVVTAQTTSSWRLAGPATACAEAMITWRASDDHARLIDEAFDQAVPHTVCVSQIGPQLSQLALQQTRFGAPRTDLLSGFDTVRVTSSLTLDLHMDVFDGATLHLAALARILPSNVRLGINFEAQRDDGSFQQLANVFESGEGHAQLIAL